MKSKTLYPYWHSTKVVIAGLIIGILVSIPVLLQFGIEEKDFNQPLPSLLGYIVVNLLMLIYCQVLLQVKVIFLKIKLNDFTNFIAHFFVFFITMDILTSCIKLPSFSDLIFKNQIDQSPSFFFISAVIGAPILEELIFRGIILSYLLKHKSKWGAVLFSALLFGLIHISPDQVFFAFFAGILLGYFYIKSQNILIPILFHSLNNLLSFACIYYGHTSFFEFFNS